MLKKILLAATLLLPASICAKSKQSAAKAGHIAQKQQKAEKKSSKKNYTLHTLGGLGGAVVLYLLYRVWHKNTTAPSNANPQVWLDAHSNTGQDLQQQSMQPNPTEPANQASQENLAAIVPSAHNSPDSTPETAQTPPPEDESQGDSLEPQPQPQQQIEQWLQEAKHRLENENTVLHQACQEGHRAAAGYLLAKLTPVQAATYNAVRQTPLYLACRQGHTKIAELIVQKLSGTNRQMSKTNMWGDTPFLAACRQGHTSTIQALIGKINPGQLSQANNSGETPLTVACQKGHTKIAKLLLPQLTKSELSAATRNRVTAFAAACGYKPETEEKKEEQREIMEFLFANIDRKKINQPDAAQITPLILACANRHTKIAHLLLEDSTPAEVTHTDHMGRTPLIAACMWGHVEILPALLAKLTPEHINHSTQNGTTALIAACFYSYTDIAKLLLDELTDAQISHANQLGITALHLACEEKNLKIVKLIIERLPSEQRNPRNKEGKTPFWIACKLGAKEIVAFLCTRLTAEQINEPNTAAQAKNAKTPLQVAAEDGRLDVVTVLLADPRVALTGVEPYLPKLIREACIQKELETAERLMVCGALLGTSPEEVSLAKEHPHLANIQGYNQRTAEQKKLLAAGYTRRNTRQNINPGDLAAIIHDYAQGFS